MPLSKYFEGSGEKVMKSMKKQYGPEKGKRVFYATANKRKKKSFTGPTEAAEEREMKRLKPPNNMLGARG